MPAGSALKRAEPPRHVLMRIDTPRVPEQRNSLVSLLGRFLVTACAVLCLQALAGDSLREHLSLDAGWKFHLGDDWPKALQLDKADPNAGPARPQTSTSPSPKLP